MQVENCYKIRNDASLVTKTPTPKQKDVRAQRPQSLGSMASGDMVEEAAMAAAYKVAEAENKSFLAAEAVKEAERVSKMAEDADSTLQIVKQLYEQCNIKALPVCVCLHIIVVPVSDHILFSSSGFTVAGSNGEAVILAWLCRL